LTSVIAERFASASKVAVSLDKRRPRSTPFIASDDEDATDRE